MLSGATYLIILLSTLIFSLNDKRKSTLIYVIICVVILLVIDIYIIITEDNKKDFLDYMMPKITIHERLEMLKIILLPLMYFVKFFCIHKAQGRLSLKTDFLIVKIE